MDARAWRVACGTGAALLGITALVLWRSDDLTGGWLAALRATALLAVAGLLGATLLAGRHGTAPTARREVVVRVPTTGAPQAQVRPAAAGTHLLRSALLLGVLSAAPVLVVLVLAPPAQDPAGGGGPVTAGSATPPHPPGSSPAGTDGPPAAGAPPAVSPAPRRDSTASTGPDPTATAPGTPAGESGGAAGPPPTGTPPTGPPVAALPGIASAGAPATGSCERTVVRGDSLWGISAKQLGPGATPQQIEQRWHAVYALNAAGVGADPDLIRPGLVLRSCG